MQKLLIWATTHRAYSLYSTVIVVVISLITYRPATSPATVSDAVCDVAHVIDGDSLTVFCGKQSHNLRLMHIDAPEITQAIWGEHARSTLQRFAQQQVFVDFHGKDIYQRDLALVYSPANRQVAINLRLVEQGAARVYSHYQPPEAYRLAMKQAKKARRGMWQVKGLHQDPMRYRRLAY